MKADGREENRIKRGIENTFHFYDTYDAPVIDTTEQNLAWLGTVRLEQVADCVARLAGIGRVMPEVF